MCGPSGRNLRVHGPVISRFYGAPVLPGTTAAFSAVGVITEHFRFAPPVFGGPAGRQAGRQAGQVGWVVIASLQPQRLPQDNVQTPLPCVDLAFNCSISRYFVTHGPVVWRISKMAAMRASGHVSTCTNDKKPNQISRIIRFLARSFSRLASGLGVPFSVFSADVSLSGAGMFSLLQIAVYDGEIRAAHRTILGQ